MRHAHSLVGALLLLGWASSAAAVDAAWYRSTCSQTISAGAVGACLRGGGVLSLARRLAILSDVKARLAGPDGKRLLEDLEWGALAEEPELRRAIGEVLVGAKVISRESVARIPAASEALRAARVLVRRSAHSEVKKEQAGRLTVTGFRLDGESAPGTVRISASEKVGCNDCHSVRVHLTLTKGTGDWRLTRATLGGNDDGTCGCCMHAF